MILFVGSDHGGFELKEKLLQHIDKLTTENKYHDKSVLEKIKAITFKDLGSYDTHSVSYPDFAEKVCQAMLASNYTPETINSSATRDALDFPSMGLLLCGSGQGMAMKANRHAPLRAALVWNEEISRLSREHNNANILCLPGRFMGEEVAIRCLIAFLTTPFAMGRHSDRVAKI